MSRKDIGASTQTVDVMTGQRDAGAQADHVLQVLVIEDNRDAADSLGMLLKMWGYECRVAYDGRSGWEMARARRPDCILLDINMPELDGFDVAERVRRQPGLEGVKLVAVTAHADAAHARRIHEAGFDHHLVKPADPTDLRGLLDMMDEVLRLAGRTEALARQNVALAGETRELLKGVREDVREVRRDLTGLKQINEQVRAVTDEVRELRDVKQALHEVREDVRELRQELREVKEGRDGG